MELPVRMICTECGRSLGWSGDPAAVAASSACTCRDSDGLGSLDFSLDTGRSVTPPSLLLTPDELGAGAWGRGSDRAFPESVGRFKVRRPLGHGGFGDVYQAFDSRLERDVALKVLRDPSPPARVVERFFREARAAAQLDHPNIVALHDAGRDDGRCWIAYQYVEGAILGRGRKERSRDHAEAARIVRAMADALDHAHSRGVYHRDVKPANILIDILGRPRLTDFGLARRADLEETMTRDGAILGTGVYMSPEQSSGHSHSADGRSDLYSLGVVFYELLCGRRPVELPSSAPEWRTIAATMPASCSPRKRERSVPPGLDRICRRALALDPEDRYPDARAMADDLDHWLSRRSGGVPRPILLASLFAAAIAAREAVGVAAKAWNPPDANAARGDAQVSPLVSTPEPKEVDEPVRELVPAYRLIGNSGKGTLHIDGCASLHNMTLSNQVKFPSLRKALEAGYRPCGNCLRSLVAPNFDAE